MVHIYPQQVKVCPRINLTAQQHNVSISQKKGWLCHRKENVTIQGFIITLSISNHMKINQENSDSSIVEAVDCLIACLRLPMEHREVLIAATTSLNLKKELIEFIETSPTSFDHMPMAIKGILMNRSLYLQWLIRTDQQKREAQSLCCSQEKTIGSDGPILSDSQDMVTNERNIEKVTSLVEFKLLPDRRKGFYGFVMSIAQNDKNPDAPI